LLLALLAGCALDVGPQAAAERRWREQPEGHYLLRTVENLRGQRCAQAVEVRDGEVAAIVVNTCRHPSLWTVEWLFHRARMAESAFHTCALKIRQVGCVCRQRIEVEVQYDQARGFPRQIRSVQVWYPAWQEAGFWRRLAQTGAVPQCAPRAPDPGWTIRVRELRPLP